MAMTLEQVRDRLRGRGEFYRVDPVEERAMADAIDAHLTQPTQVVDVVAIREVIGDLREWGETDKQLAARADQLTRAIGTARGWLDAERKASPEHQTDMLLARMVLREVIVPPAPTPPTSGEE